MVREDLITKIGVVVILVAIWIKVMF